MRSRPPPGPAPADRWAAQIDALSAPRKRPLTADRIVAAALALINTDGFDSLTMRKVAAALGASPGALYVHVQDKAELGDLMLAELCSRVVLPAPDAAAWREQVFDVCGQLRDQYMLYPGIGYAVLACAPHSLDALRITEGLLSILTAAGADLRSAAWAVDAALVFIAASAVISLRRSDDSAAFDREQMISRYQMLPVDRFPISATRAEEILTGGDRERFAITLDRLFRGLVPNREEAS